MKKILLLLLFFSTVIILDAQTIRVSGIITDDLGEPLMGATISIKGTTVGVSSDINGKYTIDIPKNSKTMSFTFVGMKPQEYRAPQKNTVLNVKFESNESMLDEVVVTGYGTYKKSAYAGSASTVKMDGMEDVPSVDFSSMLQGNAAGVQVNSGSGQPGSATDITIRGLGSFNASKSPLFVIDGVPVLSGNINPGTDAGTDIMSTISTSDIQNITVIKDAAAASLYGSRAANGVILITTKSGHKGKSVLTYKSDWGWSDFATNYRRTLSGQERRDLIFDGLIRKAEYGLDAKVGRKTGAEAVKYAEDNIDAYAPIPATGWTDWDKELFRKGSHKNYELSASGADNKMSYFSSIRYMQQEGVTYQSAFERFTGRVNVKYQMSKRLELGARILYSKVKQDVSSESKSYNSPMYTTRHKVSPSDPVYNDDGTFNDDFLANGRRNPKATSLYDYNRQEIQRAFNTIYANYKLTEDLKFNSTFSNDYTNTDSRVWSDPRTESGATLNGSLNNAVRQYNQMVWKSNLTFARSFGKHNLDVLGGYEVNDSKRTNLSGTKTNFPRVDKHEIINGGSISGLFGTTIRKRLVSYLSRANYSYNDKYFAGASLRIDGTSQLHKDSRWGKFWSVSGAWRFSEESFLKSFKHILSDSKLRVSYGTNGNLPSDYYGYLDLVSFGQNYMGNPGILETKIGNKNLKWEKNYNLNLGLDIRLFDRVNITAEYFNRETSDLLMDERISQTTGFSTRLTNLGKVENRGVEFEISAILLKSKQMSWRTGLNFGHVSNKIKKLDDGQTSIKSESGPYIHMVGKPYYSFYLYEFAGINPETGAPQFYKNDPNGTPGEIVDGTGSAERILYKRADPRLTGGWSNNFIYKFMDLSLNFTFSLGGYSYDDAAGKLEHGGAEDGAKHNISRVYKDSWKKPGDKTNYEEFVVDNMVNMSNVRSTRRIHSTDHIRLKNITLGFSIPKRFAQQAKLSKVRMYFSALNLLTFAKYNDYDPEVRSNGSVGFDAPKLKTMTVGIDIQF